MEQALTRRAARALREGRTLTRREIRQIRERQAMPRSYPPTVRRTKPSGKTRRGIRAAKRRARRIALAQGALLTVSASAMAVVVIFGGPLSGTTLDAHAAEAVTVTQQEQSSSPVVTVPDDVEWTVSSSAADGAAALNERATLAVESARSAYRDAIESVDGDTAQKLNNELERVAAATDSDSAIAAADTLTQAVDDTRWDALRGKGVEIGADGWVNPLTNGTFTSGYGAREPITTTEGTTGTFHDGVDLSASLGTPIRAAHDGTVIVAQNGWRGHSGWVIVIDHGDGIWTSYNHMTASDSYVTVGDTVKAGDIIAGVGNEGRSTGPHLHLSVWVDGETVNPKTFFANRSIGL